MPEDTADRPGDGGDDTGGTPDRDGSPGTDRPGPTRPDVGDETERPSADGATSDAVASHGSDVAVSVLQRVQDWFEDRDADEDFGDVEPDFVRDRFFDFGYIEDAVEVERTWLREPFAYASICLDPEDDSYVYHVNEPVLDDFERHVRADLGEAIRAVVRDGDMPAEEVRDSFPAIAADVIRDNAGDVANGSVWKIHYYLMRDYVGYGAVDPLFHDPEIEDISCDGTDIPVYVYHARHRDLKTSVAFEDDERLDNVTMRLAQRAGKPISVAEPLVHGSLPDGSRIQLTLAGDVATRGSNFTIRRFRDVPFTPVELIANNTFSLEAMAYFWLAIEHQKSVLFVGPTASGKTTSMNAVALFLPPDAKVISIEEMRELAIPHDNWISNVTRESQGGSGRSAVTMYDLLGAALHQRPEYLLVGEMRTDPEIARTFFQSVFTGHPGASTFHAESVESAVNRFRSEPLSIERQLLASLDVVSVQKQVFIRDRRVRRNGTVAELGVEDGDVATNHLFDWQPSTDSYDASDDLVSESAVFQEIMGDRGWSETRLLEEYYDRQDVLSYLVEHDVTAYDDVVEVLHRFKRNREVVMERVRTADGDTSEAAEEERVP